jgi:type IV pilus assembly protein PilM
LKKEDEIAATNKLLRLIRGEKDIMGSKDPQDIPRIDEQENSTEEFSTVSLIRENGEGKPLESSVPDGEGLVSDGKGLVSDGEEPVFDGEEDEELRSFSGRLDHISSWNDPEDTSDRRVTADRVDTADADEGDDPPDARWGQGSYREPVKAFSDDSFPYPAPSLPASSLPQPVLSVPSATPRRDTGGERESDQEVYRQQGELKGNMKSTLGLDIGSRYVKFVQLQRKMNKYHLISWGIVKIIPKASEGGVAPITNIMRGLFKGISASHIKVISSVGGASVIVRHIKFPPLSHKEIDESIRWEAKSYVPFPLRDVNIDYQILGKSTKNKQMDVLLVAVTKKLLQDHLDMLQNIQIKPSIIDINSLALVNSFSSGNAGRDDRAAVLLDIGSATTILNIYKKEDLYLTRDIPIAGDAFTIYLQKENHLSYEEAEKVKFDGKFDVNTIRPVLDNLTKEIRRSLIYYDNQTSRRGFSRIILTGGSSRLSGLVGYFSEELGLTVEIANPLQTIQVDPKRFAQDELQFFSPQMALAVGLASR